MGRCRAPTAVVFDTTAMSTKGDTVPGQVDCPFCDKGPFKNERGLNLHQKRYCARDGTGPNGGPLKRPTHVRAAAIAAVEVEGKTQAEAARELGVHSNSVHRWLLQYRAGELEIGEFIVGYRTRLAEILAEGQAKLAQKAVDLVPGEKSALKAALAAESLGKQLQRAVGEADVVVQHSDRDAAAERLLAAIRRRRAETEADPGTVH